MRPTLTAAALAVVVACSALTHRTDVAEKPAYIGPHACGPCHESIYRTFVRTAHFATSQPVAGDSIKGSFAVGRNLLRTRDPGVFFTMEERRGRFYQTATWHVGPSRHTRSESFDLVTGSGRRGQTYLYWMGSRLWQLPVSYLTVVDRWVNSPGFADGDVRFDRRIEPRCLECHVTSVALRADGTYGPDLQLGVSCERCHGPGSAHAAAPSQRPPMSSTTLIANPARFPRAQQLDACALCHAGPLTPTAPAFTYQPGEPLTDSFTPRSKRAPTEPDVHGDQVGLLEHTRCFRESSAMTCMTCHDPHRDERAPTSYAARCMTCHQAGACGTVVRVGAAIQDRCVECHMPLRSSLVIRVETPAGSVGPALRTHAIGVYPDATREVLEQSGAPSSPRMVPEPLLPG